MGERVWWSKLASACGHRLQRIEGREQKDNALSAHTLISIQRPSAWWTEPYPQWLSPLGSSGAAQRARRAARIAVRVLTAHPSMRAPATRGCSRPEMHQATGSGLGAEGEAEAGRMDCKQSKCCTAVAAQGCTDGCSNSPAVEAASHVQQLPAASSLRTHRCLCDIYRRSAWNCTVRKKYAARAIRLQRPANPGSAKSVAVIVAASSHAAASTPVAARGGGGAFPALGGPFSVAFFSTPEISVICAGPSFDSKFPLPAGGRAELSLAHPSPPPVPLAERFCGLLS